MTAGFEHPVELGEHGREFGGRGVDHRAERQDSGEAVVGQVERAQVRGEVAEAAAEVRHAGAGAQELGERGQQGAFEGEGPEDVAEQVRVAVGD
ncbi:hypothetical protein, partial [Actinosynnema sp.]|uniref:hypothetical protein n=1 Tax=Actinosynnema sp. TaxID=1872144 RepID=UPI003F829C74